MPRTGNKSLLLLSLVGLVSGLPACSTAKSSKYVTGVARREGDLDQAPKIEKVQLHRLWLRSLRLRRPLGKMPDPQAPPGGTDFQAEGVPSASLDCESKEALLKSLDLPRVHTCLQSLRDPIDISYRLRRDDQPKFELILSKTTPDCVRDYLAEIPVPREILFQTPFRGSPECFSARLDIEANRVVGLKLPTHRTDLKLVFPLKNPPKAPVDSERLLIAWALTPLWNDGRFGAARGYLDGTPVPDRLCRVCIGEKDWITDPETLEALWP